MSAVSEIERIKTNIANAYTTCESKGAIMPTIQNSDNLMSCIESIIGGGEPSKTIGYHGVLSLSLERRYVAGASIGDYALFGGGTSGSSTTSSGSTKVDTFTSELVAGTATALTHGKRMLKAVSNDNYAIFGGGMTTGEYSTLKDSVDAYNKDLVKTTTTLSSARTFYSEPVARVGKYAIFGGGANGTGKISTNKDAYDENLVRTTLYGNDVAYECGGSSVGGYAVFPMWDNSTSAIAETETYDVNLVKGTTSALSVGRIRMLCCNTNNYAIFAGGYASSSVKATADAYNRNLVRETAPDLSQARYNGGVANLKGFAIFAGGATSTSSEASNSSYVDIYTDNLTRTRTVGISVAKRYLAGATTGNYSLFGGGQNNDTEAQYSVNVYELI